MSSQLDKWPPVSNFSPPLISPEWQRKLNQIGGFARTGMPLLRLEWGSTCTWTNTNRDLKYLQRRDTKQVAWGVHVKNPSGEVIKTLRLGLKANIPEPSEVYGMAFPITEEIEIGIPRWWISSYTPASLIGPWDEARYRLLSKIDSRADIGLFPQEGMYYLGFHLLAIHGSDGSGRRCCDKATEERRKCFGYYREPSELDILYVTALHNQAMDAIKGDWTKTADEKTMYQVLKNLNNTKENQSIKEREEMKLRIRDAFKSHKGRFTSRKGKSSWVISGGQIY